MQLLAGDVTGKAFPQAMREFVLDPVGMSASTYEQPLPAAMRSRATLYTRGPYSRTHAFSEPYAPAWHAIAAHVTAFYQAGAKDAR